MPLAMANGVRLAYQIEGEGEPLLMVAGTGFPGAVWRTQPSGRLARAGFRVITYDYRGVGGSDKPDVPYTCNMFAQDACGLLDALGIPSAHVLGHSMGGRVAQWMALGQPRRVRSLVLVASGAGDSDPGSTMPRGIPLGTTVELAAKGYEGYIREHFASPFFFSRAFVEHHPEVVEAQFRAFWNERPPLKLYLRHVIARQAHQTAERLAEITAPTLVIVSDGDTAESSTGSHFAQSEFLALHIPNAEWKVVPGAAHMFMWEKPQESSAVIVAFLQRH